MDIPAVVFSDQASDGYAVINGSENAGGTAEGLGAVQSVGQCLFACGGMIRRWESEKARKWAMLNKGYGSKVREKEFDVDAGPLFLCPHCKKKLMEATLEKFKTRCKHCGKWIYIYKQN